MNKFKLVTFFILAAFAVFHTVPMDNYSYFFKFICIGIFGYFGFTEIGRLFRVFVTKSTIELVDFPLGLSIFALVLTLLLKISSSVFLPAVILLFFIVRGVWFRFGSVRNIFDSIAQNYFELLIFVSLVSTLMWYIPGNGLLLFPMDFDSGMIHVALPKRWLFLGEVSPDIYIRAPFLPSYAHSLYYFCLKLFGSDLFLKTFNLMAFSSVFLICYRISHLRSYLGRWPLLIPLLLALYPDTREYVISTNLDALFLLCLFSGCVTLLMAIETKLVSDLILGTLLVGFSAGLKHFGFMMSAPILVLFFTYTFFADRKLDSKRVRKFLVVSFSGALVFLAVSLPFYSHNLLNGNNILFPFFGSRENSYGWISQEIDDFAAIINVWGHRHDFLGFFTLPWNILEFPSKYQILMFTNGLDYVYPGIFLIAFLSFFVAFFKKNQKGQLIAMAVVGLTQLFFWYKGSQVVRYLFPNIAIVLFFTIYILCYSIENKVKRRGQWILLLVCFLISVDVLSKSRSKHIPVPVTSEEKELFISNRYGDFHSAINYLRAKNIGTDRFMHTGDASYTQFMTDLNVCGDWFGPCRFPDFFRIEANKPFLEFKPFKETKEFLKANKIKWIVVRWSVFYPHHIRPESLALVIPDLKCFLHEKQFPTIDIFRVNSDCLAD